MGNALQPKHVLVIAVLALLLGIVAIAGIVNATGDALEDDHIFLGSANDIAVQEELEDCDTTTSHKLQYDQTTNAFSCDSTAPGSSVTVQENNADDQSASQLDYQDGIVRTFAAGEAALNVDITEAGAEVALTDDSVWVGDATGDASEEAIGDCDDSGGNHLNYDTTTNAFSCGTSSSSAAPGFDTITSGTNTTATMIVGTGGSILISGGGDVEATEVVEEVFNDTGATLFECTPVFISGFNVPAVLVEVDIADSDDVTKMPVAGLMLSDTANGAIGFMVEIGTLIAADTTTGEGWSVGDIIYVGDSGTATSADCGEALTNVRPANVDDEVQHVGLVVRVNPTMGIIDVTGTGQSHDNPNLADDSVWVGSATNLATATAIADCDDSGGNHLNYDTTTNAISCGTSSSGGGGGDSITVNTGDAIDTTANFLDGDIDFSFAGGPPGGPDDITATVACTDCVTLATETTGAYVATTADAGNSNITVVGSGAENGAVTLDVIGVNCTDCIGVVETDDSFLLNTGDTTSGNINFNDGVGDSPRIILTPQTGGTFNIVAENATHDVEIYTNTAITETVDIENKGAGVMDLTLDGVLHLLALDCTGNTNGGALTANASGVIACSDDDGGAGGSAIVFDIGDDGGDDSVDVNEIATTGDTNTIFTEPSADKILIAVGNNWPTSDTADALSANPSDCAANQFADAIAANGDLTCNGVVDADVSDTITVGNAGTVDPDALSCDVGDDNLISEDCIGDVLDESEIEDIYLLNNGDATTGDLDFNDGATDSPKSTFTPATGTAWDLYVEDTGDDLQLEVTTASTETIDIVNTGAGDVDLSIDSLATGGAAQCVQADTSGVLAITGSACGGGSGSMTTVEEGDVQLGGSDIVTLDFGAGFDLTESPDTEINIVLDYTEDPVDLSGAEVTGTLDTSDHLNLAVSGTLLDLTGDTLSINEGTLTDEGLCMYEVTGTQIECTVTTKALLEAQLSDVADIAEADGDTFTGVHDFGGATSIEIVNGTAPTINAEGEVGHDTTADQLIFGAGADVLDHRRSIAFTIETPVDADNILLGKLQWGITITDVHCIVDPADSAESVVIDIEERGATGDTPVSFDATITCDNDGAEDDGAISNATFDAGDWVSLDIGTVTGTVTQVSGAVYFTIIRE